MLNNLKYFVSYREIKVTMGYDTVIWDSTELFGCLPTWKKPYGRTPFSKSTT